MNAILSVAAGGALGSVARYGVNIAAGRLLGPGFPYGTLIVNIVGSFLIGLLVAVFAHLWQTSEAVKLFLVTGILGGFTTFSTFSLDAATLLQRHDYIGAAAYLGASVVLGIGALFAAMIIVRSFLV
jgi:fluoride exporter